MAAAAVSSGSQSHRDDVFASVFPPANFTTPTPEATPNIGVLASPGKSFGGFNVSTSVIDDAVRFNRAWSTATRFLSLPVSGTSRQHDSQISPDVREAFIRLCDPPTSRQELAAWYSNEISVHFRHFVLPELAGWQKPVPLSKATELLEKTVTLLERAQSHYTDSLQSVVEHTNSADGRAVLAAFSDRVTQSLHSLVLHSLPRQRLQKTLASVFYLHMRSSLSRDGDHESCYRHSECRCSVSLESLPLAQLQAVGLGGDLGERAFAHAVHKLLEGPAVNRHCFHVDWNGKTSVMPTLRRWVANHFEPFIERTLATLIGNASFKLSENDRKQFAQIATANLGRLRTAFLFDYIKSWPESQGALLDIKELVTTSTAEKAHLCSSFVSQIQQRLLHAGASTTAILSIYTNVIHAFRLLDARGVLLDKVALPIRSYLRGRDDTVSIIAASFLAPMDEDGNIVNPDLEKVCPAITTEVSSSSVGDRKDHKMMNWGDMQWVPDPIDAGPEYRASKSEDVLAYILGLFDQEEFIKEATTVLAQHLLHANDAEYARETWLVEIFKSRLDATKLQAAEVMLKDVRDSVTLNKRINPRADPENHEPPKPREIQAALPDEGITMQSLYKKFEHRMKHAQFSAILKLVATRRNDMYFPKRTRLPLEPVSSAKEVAKREVMEHNVQILSGFFWPQMRANEFSLPAGFAETDASFGYRFKMLGNQRKLHFRPSLARVTVELELEDRQVRETDVPGWRASVVDAFASERPKHLYPTVEYDPEVGLTAEQLMEALKMEEELVLDALGFWVGKKVLYQKAPGTYAVLERLDMDTGSAQQQTGLQNEAVSAVMSQDAMLRESAPMFEMFIQGMLRDGGPKEVGGMMGIANMLKMVLPTFTYGEEEVRWLLGEMEGRGEVARNGEVWAVVR